VVDDSKVGRRVLANILTEQCGFKDISQASNGFEAIKSLSCESFDLVLLDWNMPKMQGIEVLRRFRALGKKTPVIMVTSERERARVIEAIAAGANDYVMKPVKLDILVSRVQRTLDRHARLSGRELNRSALVVDDSRVTRRLLKGTLSEMGEFAEVVEAADGDEAVFAVQSHDFDLILLDWFMPNMPGIEALKTIRAMGNNVPVIMVTNDSEAHHVIEAFDAGADNYIIKPFEPQSLAGKVRQVLHLHS
jgi:DNA-binding response OmpR family regulator